MKRLLTLAVFCGLLLVAFYRNAASEVNLVREIAPGVFVRLPSRKRRSSPTRDGSYSAITCW